MKMPDFLILAKEPDSGTLLIIYRFVLSVGVKSNCGFTGYNNKEISILQTCLDLLLSIFSQYIKDYEVINRKEMLRRIIAYAFVSGRI